MPWKCIQSGGKWKCVKADDPSKVVGTHDTKAGCVAQMRALYANEKEK